MDGLLVKASVREEGVFVSLVNAENHNEKIEVEFFLSGNTLRCVAKGSNHKSKYHIGACNSLDEAKRCLPSLAIENGLNLDEDELANFVEDAWRFNKALRNHLVLLSM